MMRKTLSFLIILNCSVLFAADHYDGNMTTQCFPGVADINDFFSFTTPDKSKIVFIQTVGAQDEKLTPDFFSDRVVYQFRARPANVNIVHKQLAVQAGTIDDEDLIRCTFSKASEGAEQTYFCQLNCVEGMTACFKKNGVVGQLNKSQSQMRVYAGLAKDPFISAPLYNRLKRPRSRQLNSSDLNAVSRFVLQRNPLQNRKILALVVELDLALLKSAKSDFGKGMIGAVAETFTNSKECQ